MTSYPIHLRTLYAQAMQDARLRFDSETGLVASGPLGEGGGATFRPAASLPYAYALLKEGDAASIQTACKIIRSVLLSQECDPVHPHVGNFKWLAGDADVTDLNAVQFVLRNLLPLLVAHGQLLTVDVLESCRKSVWLALAEEEQLAVSPAYTNIHLMSLFSILVGGGWLGNRHFEDLGLLRWKEFVQYTLNSGAPHEYNSTNYCAVDLSTLAEISQLAKNPEVKLQARLLYERFWLHIGLHFHFPIGQFVGPQARAYWLPMTTGQSMMANLLWRQTGWQGLLGQTKSGDPLPIESLYGLELLLTEHELPPYLSSWLENHEKAMPYEVCEVSDASDGDDLTTYLTPSFALGTSSKTYGIGTNCFYIEHQANYLTLHYARPKQPQTWGLVYSRFVINDRHWGTLGAAPDRPKTANFYDQGHFASVQCRNKAICLYALMPQEEEVFSIKTVIAFQMGKELKKILVNGEEVQVGDLPASIPLDSWLVVEDGAVFIGVRPLDISRLGAGFGATLERGPLGELWLSLSNYRGAPKRFWEYASLGGAFWRGNLKAGFIIEVAEESEYQFATDFLAFLQKAHITDRVDENALRTVSYESGGEHLRVDFDLMKTQSVRRWRNKKPYVPSALNSPLAVQGSDGILAVGQAKLVTDAMPMWLVANELLPGRRYWSAANPQAIPTRVTFETPCGAITADSWKLGRITWYESEDGTQKILIEGVGYPEGLRVPEGIEVKYISYNGGA